VAVVFVHQGYSPYLEFTLRQARAADPEADIVLLGDAENDRFPFVRHVDATAPAYRAAAAEVADVYRHYSTNRAAFELGCYERWFLLRTFVEAEGLGDVVVLDSDVLLYSSEAEVRRTHLGRASIGVAHPNEQPPFGWTTSAHVSYWTRERLSDFCAYAVRSFAEAEPRARYEQKWQHHLDRGLPGGVCDMTTLHLYVTETFGPEGTWPDEVVNLLSVRDGAAFDHNIGVAHNEWPDEYAAEGGSKALRWAGGGPVGESLRTGEDVRFHALHLQGHSKARIPSLYRGPDFPQRAAIRRQMASHYRFRGLASRLLRPIRLLAGRLKP
jgi:hypothetical protein